MLSLEEERRNFEPKRERGGNDSGLTPKQLKQLEKQRKEEQEQRDANTQFAHLEKFTRFYNEGLTYIKDLVGQGEFASRGERTELYNLITLVKIQESLKELISVLKSRK